MNSVTENYLKRVAPGQEKRFLEILTSRDDSKNGNHELKLLLDAYKSANTDKQKMMILSAIDPKTYTKEQVMRIFDCLRYKVDAVLNWRKVVGALREQKKIIFARRKLNIDHVKHFLKFLFSSGLMPDIAYGSTILLQW